MIQGMFWRTLPTCSGVKGGGGAACFLAFRFGGMMADYGNRRSFVLSKAAQVLAVDVMCSDFGPPFPPHAPYVIGEMIRAGHGAPVYSTLPVSAQITRRQIKISMSKWVQYRHVLAH